MYLRSLQLARAGIAREADTGGAGGSPTPAVTPAVPAAPRTSVPETYSADFVRAALAERDSLRSVVAATESKAAEARAAAEKVATEARVASETAVREAEARVTGAAKALDERLIRAEVKLGAVEAGLAHPDFLKLIDTSTVKVGEDGEVVVPEGFWAAVKSKLPHLFAVTGADRGTTSQTKAAPKPAAAAIKHVRDMTDVEAAAAEAALLARR